MSSNSFSKEFHDSHPDGFIETKKICFPPYRSTQPTTSTLRSISSCEMVYFISESALSPEE